MLSSPSQEQPRFWSFPSFGFGQWKNRSCPPKRLGIGCHFMSKLPGEGADSSTGSSELSMGIRSFFCFQLWILVGILEYRKSF